jgi:hypothetical protein
VANLTLGPTHHNVKPAVRHEANIIVARCGGTWNTYYDHPQGMSLDSTSVDFWGPRGRGRRIGRRRGGRVKSLAFSRSRVLPIRWLIWRGEIWQPGTGWRRYWDEYDLHYDHVHITYAA